MKINHKNQSGVAPLLIVVAIAVVLAVGVALWFAFTNNNGNDNANDDNNAEEVVSNVALEGTMFEATSNGRALECSWTLDYAGEALISKGTFYTDGEKISKSLAEYESDGGDHTSHTVITDDKIYDWFNEGFRVSTVERADFEGLPTMESTYAEGGQVDPNANFMFDCKPWDVDDTVFEIPATSGARQN